MITFEVRDYQRTSGFVEVVLYVGNENGSVARAVMTMTTEEAAAFAAVIEKGQA